MTGSRAGGIFDPVDYQPTVEVQPIDWGAYDVPRIWDAVRLEDDFLAWEQVKGFENLATLLIAQQARLRRLRETLVAAWDPAKHPAAAHYVALLDDLIRSVEQDAIAHASTSRALHAILTTLKAAKERIGLLKREWDNVTTDWIPEWWDNQAGDLNRRARHVMRQAEEAIADHRRRLLLAPVYAYTGTASEPDHGNSSRSEVRPKRTIVPPPPVPGYDPVPSEYQAPQHQAPQHQSPELQGLPPPRGVLQHVPAVPGSPISLLPVPPGNPYAPGGGAYVLPGPGIGRGGWIYPMHSSPSGPQAGPQSPEAMPASGQARPREEGKPRRARLMVWDVAQGVPPVIGDPIDAAPVPDDDFIDWFAELATPWTARP